MTNKLNKIVNELHNRLNAYKSSTGYASNAFLRLNTHSVEVTVLIVKMSLDYGREIPNVDKHWFGGCYGVSTVFTGEWSDIADLYCELVDLVEEADYFKKADKRFYPNDQIPD